jgi:hypothetical protein
MDSPGRGDPDQPRGTIQNNPDAVPGSMAAGEPPWELVSTRGEFWYFLGASCVVVGTVFAAGRLTEALVPGAGTSWTSFEVESGLLVLIMGPSLLLYTMAAPHRMALGLYPGGLVVDLGLRSRSYPWRDVHRRGNQLLCFAGRSAWPLRISLTRHQSERLENFLLQFPPPPEVPAVRAS